MRERITLWPDSDIENPCDYSGWKAYSFSTRHRNYRHPSEDEFQSIGFRSKLRAGTAFRLAYHEHGSCIWYVAGRPSSDPFDTVDSAGYLVWEGDRKDLPKTYAERRARAESFCEEYTAWCNGDGCGYTVESEDGEPLDSCGGFYTADFAIQCAREAYPNAEYSA